MIRVAVLLTLICIAGCHAGRVPSTGLPRSMVRKEVVPTDRLLHGMVGKEVLVTEYPERVHVWIGPIPPPSMMAYREGRRVFRGILAGFDSERLRLEPLAHWPKTFHLGPMTFTDENGKESVHDGPVSYATSLGRPRDRIETVKVAERVEPNPRIESDAASHSEGREE